MPALPSQPIPAAEFFERFVPQMLAEAKRPKGVEPVDFVLGVVLHGEGGGAWRIAFEGDDVAVEAAAPEDAVLTLVQRVQDWRGALWEGRGGWFGESAAQVFREGRLPDPNELEGPPPTALTAVSVAQLRSLDGVIRVAVADDREGDWFLDLRLGDAAFDAEPATTVTVTSADLAAIEAGTLDPFQALFGGRIEVDGNMALLLQLQAIAMQAAAAAGGR